MHKIIKAKVIYNPLKDNWSISEDSLREFNGKIVSIYHTGRTYKGVKAYKIINDVRNWNWPEYYFKFQPVQYEFDFKSE